MTYQFIKIDKRLTYDPGHTVKVTYMGKTRRITTTKLPMHPGTVNIDKDHYMVISTGEIKRKHHTENRRENLIGIRRSLSHVQDLIDCNVTDGSRCRWLTLTYRLMPDGSPMTDTAKLQHDWDIFLKRFKRYCKSHQLETPEYICVAEPQGSGAWHMHVIFVYQNKAPYLPSEDIEALWGQGFVKVKAVKDKDNIGAYFAAYLTDISVEDYLDDDTQTLKQVELIDHVVTDEKGNHIKKKFIKGGRLQFYPVGFNCVRHSRGLKYPEAVKMTNEEADISIRSEFDLVYRSDVEVVTTSDKRGNTITKEVYRDNKE